jgi:hypothetical protein
MDLDFVAAQEEMRGRLAVTTATTGPRYLNDLLHRALQRGLGTGIVRGEIAVVVNVMTPVVLKARGLGRNPQKKTGATDDRSEPSEESQSRTSMKSCR